MATVVAHSSTMMLAVSAAFAAPLLALTGEMSLGLNLFGPSRIGKSRAMITAASVNGLGSQDRLSSWNTTDAGFEQLLARSHNLACPIDDIEDMREQGRARFDRLESLAYRIGSGQSRRHDRKYDIEHSRESAPWSTIVITSGEHPLSAGQGKHGRRQGAAMRFIDVPALLRGPDMYDRLKCNSVAERQAEVERLHAALTRACHEQHGTAIVAYLEFLIAHRTEIPGWLEAAVIRFREHVRHDSTDSAMTKDLARKFGLLFAGAALAIRSGVVGWAEGEALDAIALGYDRARQLLPDEALELRDGLNSLSRGLRHLLPTRHWRRTGTEGRPQIREGYRWRSPRWYHYLMRVEAFNRLFASVSQRRAVMGFLVERGFIELAQPKTASAERKPQQQHVWIDGSRPRSFRINVPERGFSAQS